MKKIFFVATTALFIASCGGNTNPQEKVLNTEENTAVENQMQKDQKAMDSLEKAIQAQINGTDSVSK